MLDWYAQPRYQPFDMRHDGEPGDRPVVLMVHGFTGTPDELRPTAEIAHAAGFDVEVMNLPGMGPNIARLAQSGRVEWQTAVFERWADVTARYRKRVIFGYSLGAALALLASAGRPADAMVLMSPLIRLADQRAFLLPVAQHVIREMAPFAGMDFKDPRTRDFFGRTMTGLDIDDAEVQQAIREEFVVPTRLVNDCRLVGREAGRQASAIREPVAVFQGRPDGIVGHQNARWLADHLGGPVNYHEIDGNHLLPFDSLDSWLALAPMLERSFDDLYTYLTS